MNGNKIIIYNPSITTLNLGDEIIFESAYSQIQPLLADHFVVNVSTHLPVSRVFSKLLQEADHKFVCGTNLLRNMLERSFRQWDINIFNARRVGPCTLIGVGWQQDRFPFTPYTCSVYKRVLSKETLHSVRDEFTKKRLESIGFKNVINTGCATMWGFTKEKCSQIPKGKSKKVVFTLTDYKPNADIDRNIVGWLREEYDEVFLWLQGSEDYKYAIELGILDQVTIVPPSLQAYDELLDRSDIEYIGTRLHGGVRALQHNVRSMILSVDMRAEEKKRDFNLPVYRRNEINKNNLNHIIYDDRETDIHIPEENIKKWKSQFGLCI